MRIMLDTNVLISAFVFGGRVRETLIKLFETDCEIYVSEYVDAEFKHVLLEKWSNRADKIYSAYRSLNFVFCSSTSETLGHLRDEKDIPVLSDAIHHGADILLTILSPSELLENFLRKGFFYGGQ